MYLSPYSGKRTLSQQPRPDTEIPPFAKPLLHYRNTVSFTAERTEEGQMSLESKIAESLKKTSDTQKEVEINGANTRANNSLLQKLSGIIARYVLR